MLFDTTTSPQPKTKSAEPARRCWSERFFLVAAIIVSFLLAWQWLADKVGRVYQVPSTSMEPTIRAGETITVYHDYHKRYRLERGHVIIISRDGLFVVTRLIGLPGETVEVNHTVTKINGSAVAEPYAVYGLGIHPFPVVAPRKLAEDEIFVMGDNRNISLDSRMPDYAPVYTDDIVGRGRFIVWSDKRERIGNKIE